MISCNRESNCSVADFLQQYCEQTAEVYFLLLPQVTDSLTEWTLDSTGHSDNE